MLRKRQTKALCLGGVAMLAMFVIGGAMSAQAALPELLWCMESATGTYSSVENCEKLVSGGSGWAWEADPLAGETVSLDTKGLKAMLLTTPKETTIECSSYEGSSSITLVEGSQLFAGSLKFLGCKEVGGVNGACNSTEPPGVSGEIITKELDGDFVYLKAGKNLPVGLLLKPASGTVFTTLSCVGGLVKENVTGAVIGEVLSPVNTEATSGKVLYAENAVTKKQEWTKVEEGTGIFELAAFGEEALEVTQATTELLINGTALTFTVEA